MNDKGLTIPPWKEALVVSGFVAILSGLLVAFKVKPYLTRTVDPWFLLLLSVLTFLANCKDYKICDNGIVCRYFFIPCRRLKWSDFSDAVFLSEWKELREIKKGDALLLTLKPCRPYDARLYSVFSYRLNFPRKTIFIRLPKEKAGLIAQIFQDHLEPMQFRDMRE